MSARQLFASCVVMLTLGLASAPAHALGNVEGEVALIGGWATANDSPYGNPFGPGIGMRGGVSIYGVYAGVGVMG